jgi:hypothetical protein
MRAFSPRVERLLLPPVTAEHDSQIRTSLQGLNRLREIVERLREVQETTYGTGEVSHPVAGATEELAAVYLALAEAIPLIEALPSPFTKRNVGSGERRGDDLSTFRLLAADLRKHAQTATRAAQCVEEAMRGVTALKAKVTELDRLKALGLELDPVSSGFG